MTSDPGGGGVSPAVLATPPFLLPHAIFKLVRRAHRDLGLLKPLFGLWSVGFWGLFLTPEETITRVRMLRPAVKRSSGLRPSSPPLSFK